MTKESKPMSLEARREYLNAISERYEKADRKGQKEILNEFCQVCGYNRKYAIQLLNGRRNLRIKKPGPRPKYGQEVGFHLHQLWLAMGRPCSKKMIAAIPLWLKHYKDPLCHEEMRYKLTSISAATVDRLLKPYRAEFKRGLSTTQGVSLKNMIPIELLHGKIKDPGHIEADTVSHCGDNGSGQFISSLTMTDLASGWTENRATMNKTATKVVDAVRDIDETLPFHMESFSSDNGNEFINRELVHYFNTRRWGRVKMARRRPYKKNDAAHVEQKNYSHVRQLFGYVRLDDPAMVPLMNEIYRAYWNPLLNFFIPNMKLVKKERVGSRIRKTYEPIAKTPYERLLESDKISDRMKSRLRDSYSAMNPFTLRKMLDEALIRFKQLVHIAEENRKIYNERVSA